MSLVKFVLINWLKFTQANIASGTNFRCTELNIAPKLSSRIMLQTDTLRSMIDTESIFLFEEFLKLSVSWLYDLLQRSVENRLNKISGFERNLEDCGLSVYCWEMEECQEAKDLHGSGLEDLVLMDVNIGPLFMSSMVCWTTFTFDCFHLEKTGKRS